MSPAPRLPESQLFHVAIEDSGNDITSTLTPFWTQIY